MTVKQYDCIYIGTHFLSALINGDYTGLSDDEEISLNNWLHSNVKPCTSFVATDFTQLFNCQITFKLSDCTEIKLFA